MLHFIGILVLLLTVAWVWSLFTPRDWEPRA
jgi:hypothetical protein